MEEGETLVERTCGGKVAGWNGVREGLDAVEAWKDNRTKDVSVKAREEYWKEADRLTMR